MLLAPLYAGAAWWLLEGEVSADALIFGTELLGIATGIVAKLTATFLASPLRSVKYVGAHSLAVYLGHFFPILLVSVLAERGLVSAEMLGFTLEFALGVLLPILLFRASQRFGWMWLYRVPGRLRLRSRTTQLKRGLEG